MNTYRKPFTFLTRTDRGIGRPHWGEDKEGKPTFRYRFQWAAFFYIGSSAGTVWTLGSKRIAGRTFSIAINCKKAIIGNRYNAPFRFIQIGITANAQKVPYTSG